MSVSRTIEHGGVVAYKTAYARLPGSDAVVALFLSFLVRGQSERDFHKATVSSMEMPHEYVESYTGLSRRQQDRAAAILSGLGLIKKELKGLPAKIHYTVYTEKLTDMKVLK